MVIIAVLAAVVTPVVAAADMVEAITGMAAAAVRSMAVLIKLILAVCKPVAVKWLLPGKA